MAIIYVKVGKNHGVGEGPLMEISESYVDYYFLISHIGKIEESNTLKLCILLVFLTCHLKYPIEDLFKIYHHLFI